MPILLNEATAIVTRPVAAAASLPRGIDLRVSFYLFLAFASFYLATTSAQKPMGDEGNYINVAETLLQFHAPMVHLKEPDGSDALWLSKYPLGQSLLELPTVAVLQAIAPDAAAFQLIRNMLPAFECALMVGLLYWLAVMPVGGNPLASRRAAAVLAVATGLATQLWPSASTHFADTSAACLTLLAIAAVVSYCRAGAGCWSLLIAGLAAAMAFTCKNNYALIWPGLGISTLWAMRRRALNGERFTIGRLAAIAAVILVPCVAAIAGQLWYNDFRFHSIWLNGYHVGPDAERGFNTPLLVGLYGTFFSTGRSVFLYSPLCVMAFLGARRFVRLRPFESLLAGSVALPLILSYAKWWAWNGGWEWGSRFHLYLVPILMWVSAPAWKWLDCRRGRAFYARAISVAALFGIGLFMQCLGVLIRPASAWEMMSLSMTPQVPAAPHADPDSTRSEMPMALYAPQFSPVAINAWLAWATWNRAHMTDREIAARAPMRGLNAVWTPTEIRSYLGWNLWVQKAWDADRSRKAVAALVLALCLIGIFSLFRVVRLSPL